SVDTLAYHLGAGHVGDQVVRTHLSETGAPGGVDAETDAGAPPLGWFEIDEFRGRDLRETTDALQLISQDPGLDIELGARGEFCVVATSGTGCRGRAPGLHTVRGGRVDLHHETAREPLLHLG